MSDPLKSYRWQQLRKRVLDEERICWLCGLPIDFDAPHWSRWSPSVDHIVPWTRGGEHTIFDRQNLRAAHFGCNSRKRDKIGPAAQPRNQWSRRW